MKLNDEKLRLLTEPLKDAEPSENDDSERQKMFDAYMGEPDGREVPGRSSFQATDTADTVEAFFSEGIEIFIADEPAVEFAPVDQDDEDPATQETETLHHIFTQLHNAFILLSTWFKEGLIQQNSYVESGWVDKVRINIDDYEDLSLEQFMVVYARAVDSGGDYEIKDYTGVELIDGEIPKQIFDDSGEPEPISVRIRTQKREKKYEIEPVPQEEVFVSRRWHKPTLDGCPVHGRRTRKSKGDLLAMGFHPDDVDRLAEAVDDASTSNRHNTRTNDDSTPEGDKDSRLEVTRSWVRADLDDDGVEELYEVWSTRDGGTVLRWKNGEHAVEEVERGGLTSWSPYLVPHRHVGRSVAELAMHWEKLKTTLWRHTLDSIYGTNYPRPEVDVNRATADTFADLASTDHGAPIRVSDINAINWLKPPSILGETLPLMERADSGLEANAGASRYAQGLDRAALSKSQIGSEGIADLLNAAQRRFLVVIRTFAEVGLRELFLKMHADMRRGPVRELSLQLHGDAWTQVNPLKWRERTEMRVKVGSGRADKAQTIAALEWMLEKQMTALELEAPNVNATHVHETLRRLARARGLTSISPFMDDPATIQDEPEQPEEPPLADQAALVLAQAEQTKAEAQMAKAETDRARAQMDAQFEQERIRLDAQIASAKAREAEAMLSLKAYEVRIREAEARTRETVAAAKIEADDEDRTMKIAQGATP